jgi:hypothetical protein
VFVQSSAALLATRLVDVSSTQYPGNLLGFPTFCHGRSFFPIICVGVLTRVAGSRLYTKEFLPVIVIQPLLLTINYDMPFFSSLTAKSPACHLYATPKSGMEFGVGVWNRETRRVNTRVTTPKIPKAWDILFQRRMSRGPPFVNELMA